MLKTKRAKKEKSSRKHKSSSSKKKKEKKAKKSRSPVEKSLSREKKSQSRKRKRSRSESRETDVAFSQSIARRNSDRDQDSKKKKLLSSSWKRQPNHLVSSSNGNDASTSEHRRRPRSRSYDRHRSRSRDKYDRPRRYSPHKRRRVRRSPTRKKFFIEDYTDKQGQIDKDRLLEIATKNASRLAMEGKLPKGAEYLDTIKNKSIDQLVALCREIQDDEVLMEKVSSDEEERYNRNYDKWRRAKTDKDEEEFAPRPVRNSSEIKINIPNANSLPIKTPLQRMHEDSSTLRTSFPVSSGVQHRQKSGTNDWMPVVKLDVEPVGPLTTALSKIKTNIPAAYKPATAPSAIFPVAEPVSSLGTRFQATSTAVIGPSIMPPPPAPPSISVISTSWGSSATSMVPAQVSITLPPDEPLFSPIVPKLPPPPMAPVFASFDRPGHIAAEAVKPEEGEIVNDNSSSAPSIGLPVPKACNQVTVPAFDPDTIYENTVVQSTYQTVQPAQSSYSREWDQGKSDLSHLTTGKTEPVLSVTDLVARRLRYSSRLKEDPNDFEAMTKINEIDEQMSKWAMSKNLPGQFIGSTGARVLSAKELAPTNQKFNAWAKKDLFKNAPELSGGVGMKLLQKMGWQTGQGLGREMQGQLEPLMLDVKSDRKGLQSTEDRRVSKRESVVDPSGKNPVSIVMEYCSKNRLGAPTFECMELGPQNDKRFLWKAVLNGVEYEPSLPSSNKKAGKSQVCMVILEALGMSVA